MRLFSMKKFMKFYKEKDDYIIWLFPAVFWIN